MKTKSLFLPALLIIAFSLSSATAADRERVYVQFAPGKKAEAKALLQQSRGDVHYEFDELNAIAVSLPSQAIAGIRNNPNIVLTEADPVRYLYNEAPYGIDMVQATDVWDANNDGILNTGAPTGSGIIVGVIDSGVYSLHSDFSGVGISGYPAGYNTDGLGHGTHVAGTIAAALNTSGVVGVLPKNASLHMVKVFGDDGEWIYSSTLLDAAYKCRDAECKIISMSLGGSFSSSTENSGFQALYDQHKILLVAAAGNGGNTTVSYPAGYASVISVAAIDQNQVAASFSQRNSDVELAAPGVAVLSTVPYVDASVEVGGTTVIGGLIENALRGMATGDLIDGGKALSVNSAWSGKVVLVERGDISFYDKVRNVQNSGGRACIIYNNVPGGFLGTLGAGNSSTIPAMGLSREDGLELKTLSGSAFVDTTYRSPASGFANYDGTSMATPHVSGVAALVWSAFPTKSNSDIRTALRTTAKDLGTAGKDNTYGYGLVQAKAAIDYLTAGGGGSSDTTPPVISNVSSRKVNKSGTFEITWTTNEPSDSEVSFTSAGTYKNSSLVTSHKMQFRGTKGATYTYYVSSTDASGNRATSGPRTHQN